MENRIQRKWKLEIAILIAFTILVMTVIIAVKINRIKLPEEEDKIEKVPEGQVRESLTIKRLEVSDSEVEFPAEVEETGAVEYGKERLEEERKYFVEKIRQKQIKELKNDLKKTAEEEKENIPSEGTFISTHKRDIHPSEEDIEKMEAEKVLIY